MKSRFYELEEFDRISTKFVEKDIVYYILNNISSQDDIREYFRNIEKNYGVLVLMNIIRKLLQALDANQLNEDLVDSIKNWKAYVGSYIFFLEEDWRKDNFFDNLYRMVIKLKMGYNIEGQYDISNLDFEYKFYFIWMKGVYSHLNKEDVREFLPVHVDFLEDGVSLIFGNNSIIKVDKKRLIYMLIVLKTQIFLYGNDNVLHFLNELQKLIGTNFDKSLFEDLKGDIYMIHMLQEIYLKCKESKCNDFWDNISIEKLETQINLVPFLGIEALYQGRQDNVDKLYNRISVIMVSYFGLNGLHPDNWYIKILSKIWNELPLKVIEILKQYYENFISNIVVSGNDVVVPSLRGVRFLPSEVISYSNRKLTPPAIISKLESFLGSLGIVIYYPSQGNIVSYGSVSEIKQWLSEEILDSLIEKITPGEREELTTLGDILLPFGSFAKFTSFGVTEDDNALVIVVRGGRGYPPLNYDILDIILKAVDKAGFNLEALLDFFVLNEAEETKKHLESVSRVYSGILKDLLKFPVQENFVSRFRKIVSSTASYLTHVFGFRSMGYKTGLESKYHDIGKIGPPKDFITKQGGLEKFEKQIVEMHTILGAGFLWYMGKKVDKNVHKSIEIAMVLALMHHILSKKYPFDLNMTEEQFEIKKSERIKKIGNFNGEGRIIYFEYALKFLNQLSYKQFHQWFSQYKFQILAMHIADIYDALREERPYRPGMQPNKAIEILKDELAILDNPTHPLYEIWQRIKPQLTEEYL